MGSAPGIWISILVIGAACAQTPNADIRADQRLRRLETDSSPAAAGKLERLAEDFGRTGLQHQQIRAYLLAAASHQAQGRFDRALADSQKARQIAETSHDAAATAHAMLGAAVASRWLGLEDQASTLFEQALGAGRTAHDRAEEGEILRQFGSYRVDRHAYPEALPLFEQSLAIARDLHDPFAEEQSLYGIGQVYRGQHQPEKALDLYQRTPNAGAPPQDRRVERLRLFGLGDSYFALLQYTQAISAYRQALALDRRLKNPADESEDWNALGNAARASQDPKNALAAFHKALGLKRRIHDRAGEAHVLRGMGFLYYADPLSDYRKSISCYQQALDISRKIQDPAGQSFALDMLGSDEGQSDLDDLALAYYQQALAIRRRLRDRLGEMEVLNDLATAYRNLDRYDQAADLYQQAIDRARSLGERRTEADALDNLGQDLCLADRCDAAVAYLEQALALAREVKSRPIEGSVLNHLGDAVYYLDQYAKAIEYQLQALAIAREIKNHTMEAYGLSSLGDIYCVLGQLERSIPYYQQSLALARKAGYRSDQTDVLDDLADTYEALGRHAEAIRTAEQALAIALEIEDRASQSHALSTLGKAYSSLEEYPKAIGYLEQSLAISRDVGEVVSRGDTLRNLGLAYHSQKQDERAIDYYAQSLALARQGKDRRGEALVLDAFMQAHSELRQLPLAIFYGKQAVNVIQSIRSDNRGVSKDLRASYLEDNRSTFRDLADLLVSEGRLPEAQQVLNLLKDQEFLDYMQRDSRAAGPSGRADLTAEESKWAERYRSQSDVLVARGLEMEQLRNRIRKQPSLRDDPAIQKQLTELQTTLEAGNRGFQQFLAALQQNFASRAEAPPAIDLREVESFKADLSELAHGSVAIYTLVTDERYVAILVTPRVQRGYRTAISRAELSRKILAFREALENPASDPLPLAKELYGILIPAALAADLEQAHAETLMWSLDGPLRYLSLAALHDGRQYLLERYRLAVFTPATEQRLKDVPKPVWRGVAFGVTAAHPGFSALPGVAAEIESVIREKPGEGGVLEGRRMIDNQFTLESMDRELLLGYPVVHVASHFQFQPGDRSNSFLLLGDGGRFTLAQLETSDEIFTGVDLLTLSACSTGLGDAAKSDGSEVEGFGVLAQRKGAKAVVASLWSVYDASTALLMGEFYRIREADPTLTKIEALRQAQLELLDGRILPQGEAAGRGTKPLSAPAAAPQGFRHPYYWAPFFLMGNWL